MSEDDSAKGADKEIIARPAKLVQTYGPGETVLVDPPDKNPKALQRGNRLSWKGWKLVIARTVLDFGPVALMDRGATLTYFTITAMAPTLLAFYSLVTLMFPSDKDDLREFMGGVIEDTVPEELREQALDLLLNVAGTPEQSTVAIIISVLVSLFSSSAYVRAFSRSCNVIYTRTEGRSLPVTWLTMWGITVLMVLGGVIMVAGLVLRTSIVDAVLGPIAEPLRLQGVVDYLNQIFIPVWNWLRYPVVILAAIALVSCLYYFAPNVRPGRFRLLTVGSALALVVIGLLWALFNWFVSNFGLQSAYGAFGSVLAMLVMVWAMNIVLLLGVKLDAEILRAKELQVGWNAEEMVQAAPRSQDAVLFRYKIVGFLHRLARDVYEDAQSKREMEEQESVKRSGDRD